MKQSWIMKSACIEDSAYFSLFIRHISTSDPFSVIKLFDVLSINPEYYSSQPSLPALASQALDAMMMLQPQDFLISGTAALSELDMTFEQQLSLLASKPLINFHEILDQGILSI